MRVIAFRPVVSERDLLEALDEGTLAGAALETLRVLRASCPNLVNPAALSLYRARFGLDARYKP